jgi:hypothetical protein
MALSDVSDALFDPDFLDLLQYIRCPVSADGNGVRVEAGQLPVDFYGAVTTRDGDRMIRGSDGERVEGNITIHTITRLTDGQDGLSADVVIWKGAMYTVSKVKSFSNYGRGFVSAECDLLPLSGGPAESP